MSACKRDWGDEIRANKPDSGDHADWWNRRSDQDQRSASFIGRIDERVVKALTENPDEGLVEAVASAAGVDCRSVRRTAAERFRNLAGCSLYYHYILNKPRGVLSQPNQLRRENEASIYDVLPEGFPKIPFAGRLDGDTEGLLLFSDNGKLLQYLTEPKFSRGRLHRDETATSLPGDISHAKIYHVEVAFKIPSQYDKAAALPQTKDSGAIRSQRRRAVALESMRNPLEVKGQVTRPAVVHLIDFDTEGFSEQSCMKKTPKIDAALVESCSNVLASSSASIEPPFWISVGIEEGKNHQVRRLCKRAGLNVLRLVRTTFGPLKLGSLKAGAARALTDAEVAACYATAGLERPQSSFPCPREAKGSELIPLVIKLPL